MESDPNNQRQDLPLWPHFRRELRRAAKWLLCYSVLYLLIWVGGGISILQHRLLILAAVWAAVLPMSFVVAFVQWLRTTRKYDNRA